MVKLQTMLDGFIIEELKRREQERARSERQRPVLELPVPSSEGRPETYDPDDWRRDERSDSDHDRPLGNGSKRERKAPPSTVIHIDL